MSETWVPIQGYEGLYEVSDQGRVRSLDKYTKHGRAGIALHRGKILKPMIDGPGREFVSLWNKNKAIWVKVHRLVARHFLANPDNLPEVNHKDFNRRNNCVDNLEWVTHQENIFHAMFHGRFRASAKTHPGMAIKITNNDVETLRSLAANGISRRELAEKFLISKSHVRSIIIGISR